MLFPVVSLLSHHKFDNIIYFENITKDFNFTLKKLGIKKERDLPIVNKTRIRNSNFEEYFQNGIRKRAIWVFGPYMKRWGYEFPSEWRTNTNYNNLGFTLS